jgi:hypothetical protein
LAGAPLPNDVVMTLLRHHVPLSLLVDLVLPAAPCSAELLVREEEPGAWVREIATRRAGWAARAAAPHPRGDFADGVTRC